MCWKVVTPSMVVVSKRFCLNIQIATKTVNCTILPVISKCNKMWDYSPLSLNGHLYKTNTSVRRTPGIGPCRFQSYYCNWITGVTFLRLSISRTDTSLRWKVRTGPEGVRNFTVICGKIIKEVPRKIRNSKRILKNTCMQPMPGVVKHTTNASWWTLCVIFSLIAKSWYNNCFDYREYSCLASSSTSP